MAGNRAVSGIFSPRSNRNHHHGQRDAWNRRAGLLWRSNQL